MGSEGYNAAFKKQPKKDISEDRMLCNIEFGRVLIPSIFPNTACEEYTSQIQLSCNTQIVQY